MKPKNALLIVANPGLLPLVLLQEKRERAKCETCGKVCPNDVYCINCGTMRKTIK